MNVKKNEIIEVSARRLFPSLNLDQVMAELLLERAQKNMIKYQPIARQFEAKYEQKFETFRQFVLSTEPSFAVEQDYYDWELAVTGMADMEEEIERLSRFNRQFMKKTDMRTMPFGRNQTRHR